MGDRHSELIRLGFLNFKKTRELNLKRQIVVQSRHGRIHRNWYGRSIEEKNLGDFFSLVFSNGVSDLVPHQGGQFTVLEMECFDVGCPKQ